MNLLISGITGQVGSTLKKKLTDAGEIFSVLEADFSKEEDLRYELREKRPQLFINPAAYTQVDLAEEQQDLCFQVNSRAVQIIAEELKASDGTLIHFSTDYVFSGSGKISWKESDTPNPLNTYGLSKYKGEEFIRSILPKHIILRSSWVFSEYGHNFVKTILKLMSERETLNIVDDQYGSPTSADFLASVCIKIRDLQAKSKDYQKFGTFHCTNDGVITWFDFANEIYRKAVALRPSPEMIVKEIKPVSSASYPTKAKRPYNSRMDCSALEHAFLLKRPRWNDDLEMVLKRIFQV